MKYTNQVTDGKNDEERIAKVLGQELYQMSLLDLIKMAKLEPLIERVEGETLIIDFFPSELVSWIIEAAFKERWYEEKGFWDAMKKKVENHCDIPTTSTTDYVLEYSSMIFCGLTRIELFELGDIREKDLYSILLETDLLSLVSGNKIDQTAAYRSNEALEYYRNISIYIWPNRLAEVICRHPKYKKINPVILTGKIEEHLHWDAFEAIVKNGYKPVFRQK